MVDYNGRRNEQRKFQRRAESNRECEKQYSETCETARSLSQGNADAMHYTDKGRMAVTAYYNLLVANGPKASWTQCRQAVVEAFGVTATSVYNWVSSYEAKGDGFFSEFKWGAHPKTPYPQGLNSGARASTMRGRVGVISQGRGFESRILPITFSASAAG